MAKFLVKGHRKLNGEIYISGSKNTILALIPASILVKGKVIFKNVPRIKDVEVMLKIMQYLGAETLFQDNTLIIDTTNLEYRPLTINEVKQLRASILFLGPLLVRFGKIKSYLPGGDVIGARPLEAHFEGLQELGCKISVKGNMILGSFKKFQNDTIILKEASVTATETLIMASCLSSKKISLRLVSLEPHVQHLCRFLIKAGYRIKGTGTHFLEVSKGEKIKRLVSFYVNPDYIETASFLALTPVIKNKLILKNNDYESLDAILSVCKAMGVNYSLKKTDIILKPSLLKGAKIQTGLHPKFPSDAHPPFGVMATQAYGVSFIHEWLYENRFGYLNELKVMGANVEILDPHRAIIIGPTPLFGKEVGSLDIRSGISLLIGALYAYGETVINDVEKIDRGYEKIEEKLLNIGAYIKRLE
ncbi:MAG: UDP-N-acetylglucosamine 1-carboxyvinyltransferase [Candidatus Parcubacteria bacterium]|nr:MAG: UDP-N-acetylglucosamine 1-carboxyvinyltransferase [Candidatus Parcubacteria bacterium]